MENCSSGCCSIIGKKLCACQVCCLYVGIVFVFYQIQFVFFCHFLELGFYFGDYGACILSCIREVCSIVLLLHASVTMCVLAACFVLGLQLV